jgi:hypothetical protein
MNVMHCLGFLVNEQTIVNKDVTFEDTQQHKDIIENDEYVELSVPLTDIGSTLQIEYTHTQGDSILSGNYDEVIQKANENIQIKIQGNSFGSLQIVNPKLFNIRKTLMKNLF